MSMQLLGSLSTRCREVADDSQVVMDAIGVRLNMEPPDALTVNEAALDRLIESMVANPSQFTSAALRLFTTYQSTGSPYSEAVADELHKLCQLLELSTPLIEKQWPRISLWLWGPRSADAIRFLTRACKP